MGRARATLTPHPSLHAELQLHHDDDDEVGGARDCNDGRQAWERHCSCSRVVLVRAPPAPPSSAMFRWPPPLGERAGHVSASVLHWRRLAATRAV